MKNILVLAPTDDEKLKLLAEEMARKRGAKVEFHLELNKRHSDSLLGDWPGTPLSRVLDGVRRRRGFDPFCEIVAIVDSSLGSAEAA